MNNEPESLGPCRHHVWHRIVLMVSPDGNEFNSVGGDYAPNPHGCDQAPLAHDTISKWHQAYKRSLFPWYRRDQYGWPIETFRGRPIKSFVRLVCQNFRKLWPRRKLRFRATQTLGVAMMRPKVKIRIDEY